MSRCLVRACDPSSSVANMTKASPIARPLCVLTNNTPASPSSTVDLTSSPPDLKNVTFPQELNKLSPYISISGYTYHLFGRAIVR